LPPNAYRADSDFPDTLLNRNYLAKPSHSDKQGLTVSCPDLFTGHHLLTSHAKTCERMLRQRVAYGDNSGVA